MRFSSCLLVAIALVGCGRSRGAELQKEIDALRTQVADLRRDVAAARADAAERAAEPPRVEPSGTDAERRADAAVAVEASRQADAAKRLVEDRALLAHLKALRDTCREQATTHVGAIESCDAWLADAAKAPRDAEARGAKDEADASHRALKASSQSELSQCKARIVVLDLAIRQLGRRIGEPEPTRPSAPMGDVETRSLLARIESQRTTLVTEMDAAPAGVDVHAPLEWRTALDLAIAEVKSK